MMQRRRHEEETTARHPAPHPPRTGAAPGGRVRVVAGADVQDVDLAGRRVADARAVAQAILGIHPAAVALLDGREVRDEQVLEPGQLLEFVKHAGQKGAGPVIEMAEDRAVWRRNGQPLGTLPVRELLARAGAGGDERGRWRLHPPLVRLMAERARGHVVGVVIEMAPGPRHVRWVADGSPGYGPHSRFETRQLSFPWVVLVVVFVGGELSGHHQAFYRTQPIRSLDDPLCLTNLLNVAAAYRQESWLCLAGLGRSLARLDWDARVHAVVDHVWQAAFTRSAEAHEGNSAWGTHRDLDPRLASPAAWEAATREDPYFTLGVRWPRAPRTLAATLVGMLDDVAPARPIERVEHLVTLMQQDAVP
jgi:hypothetical protein